MLKQEKGMSAIGILIAVLILIFVGIAAMRVAPVYLHYYKILKSVKDLKNLPSSEFSEDAVVNAHVLKKSLLKRFAINDIDERSFDSIAFTKKDNNIYNASVKYKVIKPFIGNVSLLFNFNILEEIKIANQ